MLCSARRPEAKAVVMFRRQDQRLGSCCLRRASPLSCVEIGRGEDCRVFSTIAPLAIGKRVDAEVQKECELVTLPPELRWRWARTGKPHSVRTLRQGTPDNGRDRHAHKRAPVHVTLSDAPRLESPGITSECAGAGIFPALGA